MGLPIWFPSRVWLVSDRGQADSEEGLLSPHRRFMYEKVPPNTRITAPFTLMTSGSRNLDFTLQPPPGVQWPLGVYRVEVYVNGNLDLDVDFDVE
jgi:sporulation-control protein spo0M